MTGINQPLRAERMSCYRQDIIKAWKSSFFLLPLLLLLFFWFATLLRFPTKTEDVSQLQISARIYLEVPQNGISLQKGEKKALCSYLREEADTLWAPINMLSAVSLLLVCRKKTFITLPHSLLTRCIKTVFLQGALSGCTALRHNYIKL